MISLRVIFYRSNVLTGIGVEEATVRQLAMMQEVLSRGEMLNITIADLIRYGSYDYYAYTQRKLKNIFDALHRRGILHRSVRPAYANARGVTSVTVWGLTDKARALLDEYYAWIGGAHDAEFVGKPVKIVRSHRGK